MQGRTTTIRTKILSSLWQGDAPTSLTTVYWGHYYKWYRSYGDICGWYGYTKYTHDRPSIASEVIQRLLHKIKDMLQKWLAHVNGTSTLILSSLQEKPCPTVQLNNYQYPQMVNASDGLGKIIYELKKQFGLKLKKMFCQSVTNIPWILETTI